MARRRGWRRQATAREREMRTVLRELDRSGLQLKEFARQRGISPGTLAWWRYVARRRGEEWAGARRRGRALRSRPEFVEITSAPPCTGGAGELGAGSFEIVLPRGYVVRVPVGFDGGALRRLVSVLDGTC